MKLYSVDIPITATAYIKANSAEEALKRASSLALLGIEFPEDLEREVPISGRMYDDPNLPEISLSPAMTIGPSPIDISQIAEIKDLEPKKELGTESVVLPPRASPDRPYDEWGF